MTDTAFAGQSPRGVVWWRACLHLELWEVGFIVYALTMAMSTGILAVVNAKSKGPVVSELEQVDLTPWREGTRDAADEPPITTMKRGTDWRPRRTGWDWVVIDLLLAVGTTAWFLAAARGKFPRWLTWTRPWSMAVLMFVAFTMAAPVTTKLFTDRDAWLATVDRALFGGVDPIDAMTPLLSHPLLVDVLTLCYFLHYVIWAPLVFVMLRAGDPRWRWVLNTVLVGLLLSFFCYGLFPGLGPRYYQLYHRMGEVSGTAWVDGLRAFLNSLEHNPRDIFPSLHTGVAVMMLILMWRYRRIVFWVMLLPALCLIAATMVLRYHYVTDVAAGILYAILFAWGIPRLSVWWDRWRCAHGIRPLGGSYGVKV